MLQKMMRAKIHRATVTQCDASYVGSITIDADLLRASNILPNEAVHVYDIDNAARFETYVFYGNPGSGVIAVNGAAAKLVEVGDKVIIVSFGYLSQNELGKHVAKVVVADENNGIEQILTYPSMIDQTETVDTP